MPDPDQPSDACLVLLPHRDEQLVRLLSVHLRQLRARLLRFRHRRDDGGIVELISFDSSILIGPRA